MIDERILKNEERAIFNLRSLYTNYGYSPFKMSRFEEYDLYVLNKDFLVGEGVITFNDTDGRLLAMKPDVTLSIIKNSPYESGARSRVYYNENVYRVSGGTHRFKEIMQTGIECVGDLSLYDRFEVIYLAARSLAEISGEFVIDISHMGVFSEILDSVSTCASFKMAAQRLISQKNAHELLALCDEYGIDGDGKERVSMLAGLYGRADDVLSAISRILPDYGTSSAYAELSGICAMLSETEFYDRINLDFSVLNDMNYYNGILFKGFISGICESVLAGGEYMPLVERMNKSGSGVGFAIYLDHLSELEDVSEYDFDVMLVVSDTTDADALFKKKKELIDSGLSVTVGNSKGGICKCRSTIYLD